MNQFPDGWNEARIRRVIEHYENQTDDEAVAEDEAALSSSEVGSAIADQRRASNPDNKNGPQ